VLARKRRNTRQQSSPGFGTKKNTSEEKEEIGHILQIKIETY
jgi:hypothetical protein